MLLDFEQACGNRIFLGPIVLGKVHPDKICGLLETMSRFVVGYMILVDFNEFGRIYAVSNTTPVRF